MSVNETSQAISLHARDKQSGNSPALQITTIPIAAATAKRPSPNPRAFVQSGFNEVRTSPSRSIGRRTSQKPLDSQISREMIQGSFGGGYPDPGIDERGGMGLP